MQALFGECFGFVLGKKHAEFIVKTDVFETCTQKYAEFIVKTDVFEET